MLGVTAQMTGVSADDCLNEIERRGLRMTDVHVRLTEGAV